MLRTSNLGNLLPNADDRVAVIYTTGCPACINMFRTIGARMPQPERGQTVIPPMTLRSSPNVVFVHFDSLQDRRNVPHVPFIIRYIGDQEPEVVQEGVPFLLHYMQQRIQ